MTDIFDDLFSSRSESKANDPRYAPAQDDEDSKQYPTLGSPERMAAIFEEIVKSQFPSPADIARYRTTGQHVDPYSPTKEIRTGHRTRLEMGSRRVDDFVGHVKEVQWGIQALTMLQKGNETTFAGYLNSSQNNGDWVPMHVQTRFGKELTMNGRKTLGDQSKLPGNFKPPQHSEWSPDMLQANPLEMATPVAVTVMEYAILWVDRRNAPDMAPTGPDGKPIQDQIVNVQVHGGGGGGTDPRLIEAIQQQGAGIAELAKAVANRPAEPAPVVVPADYVPGLDLKPRG